MFWINASSYIAFMKNVFSFCNFSIMKLIRKFMSSNFSSFKEELSVPIIFAFNGAYPQPTSRGLFYKFPKSDFRRNCSKDILMLPASFRCLSSISKLFTAVNTGFHKPNYITIGYVEGT